MPTRPIKYYSVLNDGRVLYHGFTQGKSNADSLGAAFASDPQQGPAIDRQWLLDTANLYLNPKSSPQLGNPQDFPKGVNLNFSGTDYSSPPSYNDVKLEIGGVHKSAITSPFTPNIASPGAGNGVTPPEKAPPPELAIGSYLNKKLLAVNPSDASSTIGSTKTGDVQPLGSSPAKSRGTAIDGP